MDPAEDLARLLDSPGSAAPDRGQGVAARPVDPGQAEELQGDLRSGQQRGPGLLGQETPPAARTGRQQIALLVDPAAAARAAEPFGPVDILVNAAGINLREPAEAITPESWDRTLSINLTAPFFLAREVVPAMRGKGWDGSSTSRPCSRCAPFRAVWPTAPPRAAWST